MSSTATDPDPAPAFAAPAFAAPPEPAYPEPSAPSGLSMPGYTPLPAASPLSAYAIASMVLGIACFLGGGVLTAVPAAICGHLARREIVAEGMRGHGPALAGLILAYLTLGLTVVIVLSVVAVALVAYATS